MEKYFFEDIKNKKEMKFLELKQGNMTVVEYAMKFEELYRYFPYYNEEVRESSKCVKFVNGFDLRSNRPLTTGRFSSFLY